MADEFATALIKFVADDTSFNTTADKIVQRARSAAQQADQAFRESFRRVQGESGAQPVGGTGQPKAPLTEREHVAQLEKQIASIRGARAQAEAAGRDVSAGFAEGFKGGLAGIDKPLLDIGSKIGGVARLLTSPTALFIAAGTAIAAAAVKSTEKALEFDKAFRDMAVYIDPAAVSIEKLRARIEALDPKLGTATERIGALKQAFLDTGDISRAFDIEKVAAELHKITGISSESAARILGSLEDAFHETGVKAQRIGDVLLEVTKRGGGDIGELGSGFLQLADAAANLNIGIEDLGAALVTLGERAGGTPQKNIQALSMLLRTLSGNTDEFKRRGFDLKEVVKVEGFAGLLRVMEEASRGSAEQLKELGVSGRAITQILKLASEEGVEHFNKKLGELQKTAEGSVGKSLETRAQFVSDTLERGAKVLDAAQLSFGSKILGLVRPVVKKTVDEQLVSAEAVLKKTDETIATLEKRIKGTGDSPFAFGASRVRADKDQVEQLKKRKGELEALLDALQKSKGIQDGVTDSTEKNTKAQAKAKDESTAWQRATEALNDSLRQLDTDRITRSTDDIVKAAGRTHELADATRATGLAVLEAERQIEQTRAQHEGREAQGIEELLARRKAAISEGLRDSLKALDDETKAKEQALVADRDRITSTLESRRARPNAKTDPATLQEINTLTGQLEASENKITELQEDAAQKRKTLNLKAISDRAQDDAKAFGDRQQQMQHEVQLEEDSFRRRKAIGEATVLGDIARTRAQVSDPRIPEQQRIGAIESARSKEKALDQQLFDIKRTLGQANLADEVLRQAKITAAYKQGTQERLDAEKSLADKIKALREAAASAGESLLQKAASRLQERGVTHGTLQDLGQEIANMRREALETLGGLAGGRGADLSKLGDAFSTAKQTAAATEAGGVWFSVQSALSRAFDDLTSDTRKSTQALELFAAAINGATMAVGGSANGGTSAGGSSQFSEADAWASARRAARSAWGNPDTGPDIGGAKQRAGELERRALEGHSGGFDTMRSAPGGGGPGTGAEALPQKLNEAYDKAREATDSFLKDWNSAIRSGTDTVATTLFDTFMDKLVRRLEQEAARA